MPIYHIQVNYLFMISASVFALISCSNEPFDLSRCMRIPAQESRDFVLQMDIEGLTGIRYIMAVESTDVDFWFVAMDLEGPGLESPTDIAVWATEQIEPFEGHFIPADELATRFSGNGETTRAMPFPPETDGIADAVRCTRYISAQ